MPVACPQKSRTTAISMLSTYQRPAGPWITKKFGWRETFPFVSSARTTRCPSAPGASLKTRYESELKKHCRMTSRFSSSFRGMLSRAAPLLVPKTADIAWRSPAFAAARNCSTASRGAAAPVIPVFKIGAGFVLPEVGVAGAVAHAASSATAGIALQYDNRFSDVFAFTMGRRQCP